MGISKPRLACFLVGGVDAVMEYKGGLNVREMRARVSEAVGESIGVRWAR